MATTVAFRALDDAGKLPDNYVKPYYLEDLKHRVSVARAGGKLYAFDDLCKHECCPLSSGLLGEEKRAILRVRAEARV